MRARANCSPPVSGTNPKARFIPGGTGAGSWFVAGSRHSAGYLEQGQRAWMKSRMCMRKGVNLATVTSHERWP